MNKALARSPSIKSLFINQLSFDKIRTKIYLLSKSLSKRSVAPLSGTRIEDAGRHNRDRLPSLFLASLNADADYVYSEPPDDDRAHPLALILLMQVIYFRARFRQCLVHAEFGTEKTRELLDEIVPKNMGAPITSDQESNQER